MIEFLPAFRAACSAMVPFAAMSALGALSLLPHEVTGFAEAN